jgi:hypothetical protein
VTSPAFGATVTATSPVTVQLDGASTAVPAPWHVGSYTPAVSDRVAVIAYRGGLLILGKEVAG